MIKNIVFDVGNVLISFKPMEYLSSKFSNAELAGRLYENIFRGQEWPKLDLGELSEEEAFEIFCKKSPMDKDTLMDIKSDWYSLLTPIEGSIKILNELKTKGYKAYILSNYHTKAFERTYNKHSFFQLFDGMVISARVRMLKPSPEIFMALMDKYRILPEESVFIDDTKENIETARDLGFKAILFTSPCQLKEDLKALNIL